MEKRVRILCITSKQAGTNNSLESTSPWHVFFPQPEAIAVTGASACAPYHCGSGKHTCLLVRFEGLCFKMIQNVLIDSPSSSFTFLLDLYKWLFCSCIVIKKAMIRVFSIDLNLSTLSAGKGQGPSHQNVEAPMVLPRSMCQVSLVTLENHFAALYAPMNFQVNFSAQQHLYVTKLRDEIRKNRWNCSVFHNNDVLQGSHEPAWVYGFHLATTRWSDEIQQFDSSSTLNCPAIEAPCHIAKADLRTASEFNQYYHNVLLLILYYLSNVKLQK